MASPDIYYNYAAIGSTVESEISGLVNYMSTTLDGVVRDGNKLSGDELAFFGLTRDLWLVKQLEWQNGAADLTGQMNNLYQTVVQVTLDMQQKDNQIANSVFG
jgi:hypothetical protein